MTRFAEELGSPEGLLTIVGNAAEYDGRAAAVDRTLKEFGRLDTAVANAGFATHDTSPTATRPGGPTWC